MDGAQSMTPAPLTKFNAYQLPAVIGLTVIAFSLLATGQMSILVKLVSILVLAAYVVCAIPLLVHLTEFVTLRRQWKRTTGKVIKSGFREMDIIVTGGGRKRVYLPQIEYSYSADGSLFRGRQLNRQENRTYSHEEIKKLVTRYPAGINVHVFYQEADARISVLRLNDSFNRLDVVVAAALIVMFPLLMDVLTK